MSSVSGTTSNTVNPYSVAFSTSDVMSGYVSTTSTSSSGTTTNSSSTSSSGSYSNSLVSQMSGIDVNSLVEQMMASDNIKLNQLLSDQQITQWTQDRYRAVISNMNTFNKNYFNVVNSSSYVLSPSSFSAFTVTAPTNSQVTASASAQAQTGTYTVSRAVLATSAIINGTTALNLKEASSSVNSTNTISSGNTMGITFKDSTGTVKNYTVNLTAGTYTSLSQLASSINTSLGKAQDSSDPTNPVNIGSSISASVSADGTQIIFTPASGVTELNVSSTYSPNGSSISNGQTNGVSNWNLGLNINSGSNNNITFNIGGTNHTISIASGNYSNLTNLVSAINAGISSDASLSNITAKLSSDGTKIEFLDSANEVVNMSGNAMTTLGFDSSTVSLTPSNNDAASGLIGMSYNSQTFTGAISFNLNGEDYTYNLNDAANKGKSIGQIMSDLSSMTSTNFDYNELTGKFCISSNSTGSNQVLNLNWDQANDGSTNVFMHNLFGLTSNTSKSGTDGTFTITEPGSNGATVTNTITRSTNKFSIDGVNYNFNAAIDSSTTGSVSLNVASDVSGAVNRIANFISDYNNMIDGINDLITEKRDFNYKPLTPQQEAGMTADQIAKWNQKAQQGLLANDGTLQNMLSSMRSAFYQPIQGVGISMNKIGLSTSDDATQGGKITLDVKTLTTALQDNPQQVINMFSQLSTTTPYYKNTLTSSQLQTKYNEEGIFQRISDIFQQYSGSIPDANGSEGLLLNKAGMLNDLTQDNNTLSRELKTKQDNVTDFKSRMTQDKNRYTKQFVQLQAMMQQLSSQQNWLSQMLSSSSSG